MYIYIYIYITSVVNLIYLRRTHTYNFQKLNSNIIFLLWLIEFLSPIGESSVAIPRVGSYLIFFNKGVGDSRFYLVGGRQVGR